jgi:hypothetical protein
MVGKNNHRASHVIMRTCQIIANKGTQGGREPLFPHNPPVVSSHHYTDIFPLLPSVGSASIFALMKRQKKRMS